MSAPASPPGETSFRRKYFRHRLLVLLGALLFVLTWRARIVMDERRPVAWSATHPVLVCPLLTPGVDREFTRERAREAEAVLEAWFQEQFLSCTGVEHSPVRFAFAPAVPVDALPPSLPEAHDSFLDRLTGVREFLRWFRSHEDRFPELPEHASRLYLLVQSELGAAWDPSRDGVSTRRGRLGIVLADDDQERWENTLCVLAHEMLHTVGALDRRRDDMRIAFPEGFAEPERTPLYPQDFAEVMALGKPLSAEREALVESLDELVLGEVTAREIGWLPEAE